MKSVSLILLLVLSVGGCAGNRIDDGPVVIDDRDNPGANAGNANSNTESNSIDTPYREVDVDFLGAVISPTKASGAPWDGTSASSEEMQEFVSTLASLSNNPVLAATSDDIAFMASLVQSALGPPDPRGMIEWDLGDGWEFDPEFDTLDPWENTHLPLWTEQEFPADSDTQDRWKITLIDDDFDGDDPIGNVIITFSQVERVLELGGEAWVVTGTAANPQLAAIHVAAVERN